MLGDVSRIVDLGANIGFSCLYWLAAYPNSRVIAFEPHPGHVVQAWLISKLNGLQDRVEVHPAAAGICNRSVTISDEGMASTVKEDGLGALTVEMRDVFPTLLEAPIDILKIDIEGGEYAILGDFAIRGRGGGAPCARMARTGGCVRQPGMVPAASSVPWLRDF